MKEKKVEVRFKTPLYVTVFEDIEDKREFDRAILRNVIQHLMDKLNNYECMGFSYSVGEPEGLSLDNIYCGDIVVNRSGIEGIVLNVGKDKDKVNVALVTGSIVQGSAVLYKSSKCSFDDVRIKITNINSFTEGVGCYLETDEGKKPVIVGPKKGKKRILYLIGGKGDFYTIDENTLVRVIKL